MLRFLQEFDACLEMTNRLALLDILLVQIIATGQTRIVVTDQLLGEFPQIILLLLNQLDEKN